MIFGFFTQRAGRATPEALYRRVADAGRHPALYTDLGVPDSVNGRFEALTLHVILVLRRLKSLPPPGADIAQELVDITFRELDRSLRQMGVGDISVPRRIKALAGAFYGRIELYDPALDKAARGEGMEALADALSRNLVGAGRPPRPLAAYAVGAMRRLDDLRLDDLLGEASGSEGIFPDPAMYQGVAS